MLEAAPQQSHVSTSSILKFGSSNNNNNVEKSSSQVTAHKSSPSMLNLSEKSDSLFNWHNPLPDSSGKFSPDQRPSLMMDDDDLGLSRLSPNSNDFAELKPLPYDFVTVAPEALSSDLDPVLGQQTRTNSNRNNNNRNGNRNGSVASSGSEVTSSGASSPNLNSNNNNGLTKLETIDFTASQDAFDDLASIVGISMGADSTVLNNPGAESEELDLDAWIENTAQTIKPLLTDATLDTLLPTSLSNNNNTAISVNNSRNLANSAPFNSNSTLQTLLLQGTATVLQPQQQGQVQNQSGSVIGNNNGLSIAKATLLQQRESGYSILQNRLQHGPTAVLKVDGNFELKSINERGFGNACYPDSVPHSTTSQANMEQQQSLHRRLGELAAAAAVAIGPHPNKNKGGRQRNQARTSTNGVNKSNANNNGDQNGGKKMMHYCHICNRGFLNKSNIKVHLRTHTGEKPFKCEHCTKSFRQKAHLLKHMSIHKRISRD